MENGMGKPGRNSVLMLLLFVWFATGTCWAEEFCFCSLKQGQTTLPNLSAPLLLARSGGMKAESLQLAQEDYQTRMKKRPRLHEEVWTITSGTPQTATLCVIHNLAETAGFSFLIPSAKDTQVLLEILIPKGPELGPFSLRVNGKEIETIDPWAREKSLPEWLAIKQPVNLKQGNNSLTIIQKSPQDLPIWLGSLRITE